MYPYMDKPGNGHGEVNVDQGCCYEDNHHWCSNLGECKPDYPKDNVDDIFCCEDGHYYCYKFEKCIPDHEKCCTTKYCDHFHLDRCCEDLDPFDNTDHCDCCTAKYPDHEPKVYECHTALAAVPMGQHYEASSFTGFDGAGDLEYGNCRPDGECCDEPNEYYCQVLKKCHPIERPCCHECEHYIFNPTDLDAYPPKM